MPCLGQISARQVGWPVRRADNSGRLVKYPRKHLAPPACAWLRQSLRPDEKGKVQVTAQGEATVSDLYEYVSGNLWKGLSGKRQKLKQSRWRIYLQPYWGSWQLSQVTKRSAQEWIGETEKAIVENDAGSLASRSSTNAGWTCTACLKPSTVSMHVLATGKILSRSWFFSHRKSARTSALKATSFLLWNWPVVGGEVDWPPIGLQHNS